MSAITDPDGSSEGWVPTADGADAVGEPIGAQGWFPNNNTPADKATYSFTTTVPAGLTAISNGRLVEHTTSGLSTTWKWAEDAPMSSYLATNVIGLFTMTTDTTTTPGRPYYTSYDTVFGPLAPVTIDTYTAALPAMLDFFAGLYGPYPFSSAGGTFENNPQLGYSLETQTKPIYPTAAIGLDTVAHENAHMWFGDSVTLAVWKDIWLNEGMTNFSSNYYTEKVSGGPSTKAIFDGFYGDTTPMSFWKVPTADPATPADVFDTDAMYNRGAMVIEALRQVLGTDPATGKDRIFTIQRAWQTAHRHDNATTAQWIALVKSMVTDPAVTDARLDEFFKEWLYTSYPTAKGTTRPTMNPANFKTVALPISE